jgi:Leucine-rich repeat (LRR) protein
MLRRLLTILLSRIFEKTSIEPIEFIFRDALPSEYYNQNDYYLNVDELRQRRLVWIHDDIDPNNFEYIKSYLNHEKGKEAECLSKGLEYTRDPIVLDMVNDNSMFMQLKEFWKQEEPSVPDIDASKFFLFLYAAEFLKIRGDACRHFTGNMARILLRGTHSHDIRACMNQQLKGSKICWSLFLAFAAELECEVRVSGRVMTLCSIGSIKYGDTAGTRPSLDGLRITPDAFYKDRDVGATHIVYHLVWFLCHMDLHGLDLSGCKMDENDVDALSQALSEAGDVGLQAMNVSQCSMPPGSLAITLPYLGNLTKLDASDNSFNREDCRAIARCTLLTELYIRYCFMPPGSLAIILLDLENLIKLDAHDNRLNEKDCRAIARCTLLTELYIRYCFMPPGSLAIVLPLLKCLTKLDAERNSLNEEDCRAIARCTSLTGLNVSGCSMPPGSLAIILPLLKYLTKLDAGGNSLNEEDCRAIARCTLLTGLNVSGCFENSPRSIAIILPLLKYLTKLDAEENSLNEEDCRAIARCTSLTGLNVSGCFMPPGSLAIILLLLKYLTKLDAGGNSLNEEDCRAISRCTSLTGLNVNGCFMPPGSLAIILLLLKYLTKLDAGGNSLNEADREAIEAARGRGVEVYGYRSQ